MLASPTLILQKLILFHNVSSYFAVGIVVGDGTLDLNYSFFAVQQEEVVGHDGVGKMILQTVVVFVPKEAGEAYTLEEALECIWALEHLTGYFEMGFFLLLCSIGCLSYLLIRYSHWMRKW